MISIFFSSLQPIWHQLYWCYRKKFHESTPFQISIQPFHFPFHSSNHSLHRNVGTDNHVKPLVVTNVLCWVHIPEGSWREYNSWQRGWSLECQHPCDFFLYFQYSTHTSSYILCLLTCLNVSCCQTSQLIVNILRFCILGNKYKPLFYSCDI